LAFFLSGCARPPVETIQGDAETKRARGEYLVAAMGCDDCHTTKRMTADGPAPDPTRRLAGHWEDPNLPAPPKLPRGPWVAVATSDFTAWSGPWGISYAMNLTPDESTGIGTWSEETFVSAIRTGKHAGDSRPLHTPMSEMSYAKLNNDDLTAIFTFLKSLPPIKNRIPDPVMAPPPSAR
jgi:hypothetical protein